MIFNEANNFINLYTSKMKNKETKICKVCIKPFSWRKKWERDWENVIYCSEKCRRNKKVSQ